MNYYLSPFSLQFEFMSYYKTDEIPFPLIFPTCKEFGYFVKNKYYKVVFVICLFLKKRRGRYKYKNKHKYKAQM
jgi:hypothetical protein